MPGAEEAQNVRERRKPMTQCLICRWYDGGHDADCPREMSPEQEARFNRGRRDGRARREATDTDNADPIYMFGWLRGDVAADEYENTESPY